MSSFLGCQLIFSVRFDQDNELLENRKGSNLADIIAGEGPSKNYSQIFHWIDVYQNKRFVGVCSEIKAYLLISLEAWIQSLCLKIQL